MNKLFLLTAATVLVAYIAFQAFNEVADVNTGNEGGWTALHGAVGDADVLNELLNNGTGQTGMQ